MMDLTGLRIFVQPQTIWVNYHNRVKYKYVRSLAQKKFLFFLPPRLLLPDSIYVARIFICLNYE